MLGCAIIVREENLPISSICIGLSQAFEFRTNAAKFDPAHSLKSLSS
jgi:hypothetical protein